MHMCQVCGTFYTRKSSLNSHILKEHTEGYDRYIHKCKECGKGFQNAYYLKGHVLTNHSDSEPTFQCHKCGKKFFQRHTLSNHFKQKHLASYLKCRLCHSGFNNKALLHNHFSKKHNAQFSWSEFIQGYHSCNQCGKLCTTEDQLKKHLKKCQEVHKTGSDEGATVQHHDNVVETQLEYEEQSEKYICAICHAMFDTKEEVDLHLVTHNY
ncbi:unnamed protein product [Owenia fusiformis]|uniref:C2H2-type domain-containing protein n=1 Tax=Owenia fusiformis TaxID=6347 RepID=A0A8S4NFX6_OWEFU|nr:unnamed protein product [Owenia fusiformis]